MFYSEEEQIWRGAVLMHVKSFSVTRAISELDAVARSPFTFLNIGQLDYIYGNRLFLTQKGCVNRNIIHAFIGHPTHWIGDID